MSQPYFRKVMKIKGKLQDKLTKELPLAPDGSYRSIYKSYFYKAPYRPVSKHDNDPTKRVSEAAKKIVYPEDYNRYA